MNVLLVRLSAMGDVLHALPLAANLARAGHRVAWVVERPFAALLEGNPFVETVIPVATKRWRARALRPASLRELGQARAAMSAFGPDVVLDPQGNEKSWWIATLARAPRIVLDDRSVRSNWTRRFAALRVRPPASARHVTDRLLSLLGPLRAPAVERAPEAEYLLSGSHAEATAFLSEIQGPFALYHPGAGWANKCWGEERFAALAARVQRDLGVAPIVSWGPGDEARAGKLAALAGARMIPALDFRGLARVIARAAFFAAGDTGPLHLADALGVPTVGLFGPTDAVRNGPYRGNGPIFSTDLPCAPCNDRYGEVKPCLSRTSADVVGRAVVARLAPA
jgi:lipopolysaccharide heptosyltransferase I